jgi:hypothetical protein
MDIQERTFRLSDGRGVRVTLTLGENRQGPGLDRNLKTLVFEVVNGESIGTAPVLGRHTLWSLTGEELHRYFERARGAEGRNG